MIKISLSLNIWDIVRVSKSSIKKKICNIMMLRVFEHVKVEMGKVVAVPGPGPEPGPNFFFD
jgi:hypothetical protein